MNESTPLLAVKGLRCAFQGRSPKTPAVEVVRGVNLTLWEGEILGLVGESGSGKTMTMRSLIQLLPKNALVQAEALSFGGRNLRELSEEALRNLRGKEIAMIFQDPMTSLNPLKSAGFHIMEILMRHAGATKKEARAEAESLLDRAGIPFAPDYMRRYPHELSGGMRQRVLIAMALSCRPRLLIADEPTTALDVTIQAQILSLIRSLQQKEGMSVVLITHDLGVVANTCHRVAVMYAGLIMEECSVEELFAVPLHPYTKALLRSLPRIEETEKTRLLPIEGQPPSPAEPPPGCPFAPRCPEVHQECNGSLPLLREIPDRRQHWVRCVQYQKELSGRIYET
ncbi:MAG: ABC transporter ATP-binding protein [Treponema sp.]|jgi:oligopeptide/dipeptide ABC transporter ATP-binding protein|nr:ABC transporter ATP-binding protein [Treponema sp.]